MDTKQSSLWQSVCKVSQIAPDTGVCALVDGKQVAIFKQARSEQLFAIGNYDPAGKANVLSRGMLAELDGKMTIASPMYKHHFCLESGVCLENSELAVPVYQVRDNGGVVEVSVVTIQ